MNQGEASGTVSIEQLLCAAVRAARQEGTQLQAALDALPTPIYLTDAQGVVTHFNQACAAGVGRMPDVGQDICCVTWKLRTPTGEVLPNDQCPMAVALREKRAVRGVETIAERPDGSQVTFLAFPTPILGPEGTVTRVVNLLLDVADPLHARSLRLQAEQCRRLALTTGNRKTAAQLISMAVEYEEKAEAIEQASRAPRPEADFRTAPKAERPHQAAAL